jgi:hypothetical protein
LTGCEFFRSKLLATLRAGTTFFKTFHVVIAETAHVFEEFPVSTKLLDITKSVANKKDSDW